MNDDKRQPSTATDIRRAVAGFADFCLDSLAEGHAENHATTADFMEACAEIYFRNMDHDVEVENETGA